MLKSLVKYSFIFTLFIAFVAFPISSSASKKEDVYYVALGDSLAAGQTPVGTIGKGYPDFIAESFQASGVLKTFIGDYAVSGYTTQNILNDLKSNVKKGDNPGIQAVISQASHITLDIGANDILQKLTINKENGAITFNQAEVQQAFSQAQQNLVGIITTIKTLNPDVKLYIMGYYNPLPHLPAESQAILVQSMDTLNTMLQQIALQSGSTYVPTAEVISQNIQFLPNPQDIHLSEEGYRAVANLFWNVMKPVVKDDPLPTEKEVPIVYWDGILLKKGQIGSLTIEKPINLWKKVGNKIEFVRILKPGEKYRVYGFANQYGGQYQVGAGHYVTKIEGYHSYKTPSKAKLQLVNQ